MAYRKNQDRALRKHRITVRFDDFEYENILSNAEDAGLSMSEYLRNQILHGKVEIHNHIVADFPKLEKLAQEFGAIGNNLNQLTRYFHMGGLKSKSMTDELTRCINEIMRMRKDVMDGNGR